jgi:hypothetical protein
MIRLRDGTRAPAARRPRFFRPREASRHLQTMWRVHDDSRSGGASGPAPQVHLSAVRESQRRADDPRTARQDQGGASAVAVVATDPAGLPAGRRSRSESPPPRGLSSRVPVCREAASRVWPRREPDRSAQFAHGDSAPPAPNEYGRQRLGACYPSPLIRSARRVERGRPAPRDVHDSG